MWIENTHWPIMSSHVQLGTLSVSIENGDRWRWPQFQGIWAILTQQYYNVLYHIFHQASLELHQARKWKLFN